MNSSPSSPIGRSEDCPNGQDERTHAIYLQPDTDGDVGAPKDFRLIIYFGKSEAVRIDTGSIVEIFER